MTTAEAVELVSRLRSNIEDEPYSLYYVGMSEEKSEVVQALEIVLSIVYAEGFGYPQP